MEDKIGELAKETGESFEKLFEGNSVTKNPMNSVEVDHVSSEEVEFKRDLAQQSGLEETLKANMKNSNKSTSNSQVELDSIQTAGSSTTGVGR